MEKRFIKHSLSCTCLLLTGSLLDVMQDLLSSSLSWWSPSLLRLGQEQPFILCLFSVGRAVRYPKGSFRVVCVCWGRGCTSRTLGITFLFMSSSPSLIFLVYASFSEGSTVSLLMASFSHCVPLDFHIQYFCFLFLLHTFILLTNYFINFCKISYGL